MKIVAVIGQKGGPGKSTLAVHLAVSAQAAGLPSAIIDTDPQGSAHRWFERREAEAPQVTRETDGDRLPLLAERAKANGIALLIIDTPGKAEGMALAACERSDLIIVPSRPTQVDLETLATCKRTVRIAERLDRTFVVLTQCPPASRRATETGRAAVQAFGLGLAPVCFHQRADFAYALGAGLTAPEYEPRGKAAEEANALFAWARTVLAV